MSRYKREIDVQCCNQWMNGIRTINGQYPDDDRDLTIQAGTGVTITPITAGIEISATLPAPPVPGPMTFRGTLGTGGTIASLPPATSANIGDVYVALESGTVPVTYETGDMVISNGITWVVIPSGDDPVDWSQILNTPDTIAGYGITDAYTKSEVYSKAETDALDNGKLDKITSGILEFAYTHVGATQGEKQISESGSTASSIAARRSDGTLRAQDAASGSTDLTLANTNWISQTGDSAPNNLVHRSGAESLTGNKTIKTQITMDGIFFNKCVANIETTSTWRRVYYNNDTPANQMLILLVTPQKPQLSPDEYGILMVGGTNNNNPICKWILKGNDIVTSNFVCTYDSTNGFQLWVKNVNSNRGISMIRLNETSWGNPISNWVRDGTTVNNTFDYTTYPYYTVSS